MKFTPAPSEAPQAASPLLRLSARVITAWAYLGGALLLLITGLEAINALLKLFTGSAHAAEHELVKYMVGIAIFSFLPYCQLTNGHIAVDIFTQGMSERQKAVMALLGTLLGAAIALVLIRQMALGMQSYIDFREITPVLKLPLWTAFPFVLMSLGLWLLACLLSLWGQCRDLLAARPDAAREG